MRSLVLRLACHLEKISSRQIYYLWRRSGGHGSHTTEICLISIVLCQLRSCQSPYDTVRRRHLSIAVLNRSTCSHIQPTRHHRSTSSSLQGSTQSPKSLTHLSPRFRNNWLLLCSHKRTIIEGKSVESHLTIGLNNGQNLLFHHTKVNAPSPLHLVSSLMLLKKHSQK